MDYLIKPSIGYIEKQATVEVLGEDSINQKFLRSFDDSEIM